MTPAPLKKTGRLRTLAALAALAICSCSSSSSSSQGQANGAMRIVSCSLSCGGGTGGTQLSCGLNQVAVNESLIVDFSHPVDLNSVTKNTFQITNVATGKSPLGSFSLSPGNPNRLVFRPLLTFNAAGNPVYGFTEQHSYQILIRGVNQDSGGHFVKSVGGKSNASRMFCTVAASGILDPVVGPPQVVVSVDMVTAKDPVTGAVTETEERIASGGAFVQNVWSQSKIRMHFDDVMNPATLVNPVTGESATLKVAVDPDGDTSNTEDQLEVFGDWSIVINEDALTTDVEFTPSGGFPSAGSGPLPRVIVLSMPSTISDLGAHSLTNFGQVVFAPELQGFEPIDMPKGGEQFLTTSLRDVDVSGALWGGGALLRGKTGGSGRLGPLVVTPENSPMVLDTDSQMITGRDVIATGPVSFPPSAGPASATVVGGVFEFSQVVIEPGAELLFEGSHPARVFARGQALVASGGVIRVDGKRPADDLGEAPQGHNSIDLSGGEGGEPGPGGGAGGRGGDRPDDTDAGLLAVGGSANPGAQIDGRPGTGVGGAPGLGSGPGGATWPASPPTHVGDVTGFVMSYLCKLGIVAGPGGGGAYATAGGEGSASLALQIYYDLPIPGLDGPVTPGGDEGTVGLTPAVRALDPNSGLLRGGAGGGGGGLQYTQSESTGTLNPVDKVCDAHTAFSAYKPQSAAGGGGGGGALQLQAGRVAQIDGVLQARGAQGGSSQGIFSSLEDAEQAAPGGGGAGGGILLQAPQLLVAGLLGRIDVSGGAGGSGPGSVVPSKGGAGGAGLVRMESSNSPDPQSLAKSIAPYDPTPGSVFGGADSQNVLSAGSLAQGLTGPEGRSGAQSCWIRPQGQFFVLDFTEDDFGDLANPVLGWDADVVLTVPGSVPFSFRDGNDPNNPLGVAPEALLGTDLGGANPGVVVVRFQGVHAVKAIVNPCGVDMPAIGGEVDAASLTGWVRHPADLNNYWDLALPGDPQLAAKRRPNMFRYQVIFDGEGLNSSLIAGITNLRVGATPD